MWWWSGKKQNQTKTPLRCYNKTICVTPFIGQNAEVAPFWTPIEVRHPLPLTAPATSFGLKLTSPYMCTQHNSPLNDPGHHNYVFIDDQDSIVLALTLVDNDISDENKTSLRSIWVFFVWLVRFFKHNF